MDWRSEWGREPFLRGAGRGPVSRAARAARTFAARMTLREIAPETIPIAAWWATYGRSLAIVLAVAAVAAAVSIAAGRRIVPPRDGEDARRRAQRDVATYAFAAAACVAGVALGYAAMVKLRLHVGAFFLPAGVAFYACGVLVPAWIAAQALRKRDGARAAIAAAPLALAAAMLTVETDRLEVHRATIRLASLPEGATVRVAHLSDPQRIGISRRDLRAAEAVAEFDPDFVAVTGDLIAGAATPETRAQARAWLAGLRSRHPRFVVSGDSDPDFASIVEGLEGVVYLRNFGVDLDVRGAPIHVAGVENFDRPQRPDVALAKAPPGATTILLSHNPDTFVSGKRWRAHLGLAGHTHGGQVQLPGIGALVTFTWLGARYSDGVFTDLEPSGGRDWHVDAMSVCAGLGMEGGYAPRVRLLRPPQVMLLTLAAAAR